MNDTGLTPSSSKPATVDVSFVVPCLDEILSLKVCIAAIREAQAAIGRTWNLACEIVIADNGSTDGSQGLAAELGARVVNVAEKGYGAALSGGFAATSGRYLVMGDADGSYDFREATAMVGALIDGADLCMGSRFKGAIRPGAMPWKNRYIGNPLLTGLLNLLFGARISDAHCGLRALTRACYERLNLAGSGMEFASEMVIKAALLGETIVERPATLAPDLRDRPPHLRPWRDGWRHLRYLFMLSPAWLFAIPGAALGGAGVTILAFAIWHAAFDSADTFFFGNYWVVLAGVLIALGHIAGILAGASHLQGVRAGYRRERPWMTQMARWVTLESMIITGVALVAAGLGVLAWLLAAHAAGSPAFGDSVLPVVIGALLMSLGAQNILGGFLLAIIGGNEARFLERPEA
ncbi:MAG TPA: glycosyltransferase family 2 protein [Caulobacteraceae bacterium]|nr:glycosyltransferase family 2 protein [Caulobacteraceae bacterium]